MLDTRESGSDVELLNMRCALAALDVELKLCRLIYLLRKYSPSQPRLPAGSPEGGQWTSGGGSDGTDDSAEGDNDVQIQLVQGEPSRGYSVDLEEEERRGGHAIEGHVAKNDAYLKIEVQQMAQGMVERDQYPLGLRVGSFSSLESATELVNSTLSQNRDRVERVARGDSGGDFLRAFFDSPTGYEAYLPTPNSLPYMRDTYGVGVLIARDPRAPNGFRVHTAYPIN